MEITEVKVFPVSEEKLKAFVSVVFDRCFMVNDIKIIQGRDGLFISMPSRKKKNGEFKDVAHPLNNDTRKAIELEVVAEYERVLAERGQELPAPPRHTPDDDWEEGKPRTLGSPAPRDEGTADGGEEESGTGGPVPEPQRPAAAAAAAQAPAGGVGEPPEEERPAAAAAADGAGETKVERDTEKAEERAKDKTEEDAEKSLEEVQEMHLRDSFWSVS